MERKSLTSKIVTRDCLSVDQNLLLNFLPSFSSVIKGKIE